MLLDTVRWVTPSIALFVVGPMLVSWQVARISSKRRGLSSACMIAIAATTLAWALGESLWIAWDVVANQTDAVVGFGTLVFPPLAALGATLGAYIAVWPRRETTDTGRIYLTLAGYGLGVGLVSSAVAWLLFDGLFAIAS